MRPGSPGFVGARLCEAREARGLTPASLGRLLGTTRQLVGQYESGRTTPGPALAQEIALILNMPLSFFWLPPAESEQSPIFYRSLAATARAERTTGQRRLGWLKRIVLYLQEFVDLPDVNFPELDVPRTPTSLTLETIDSMALQVRRYWQLALGPISNVLWLIENQGAVVARAALQAETLDGLSGWLSGEHRPYVFLGADKGVAVRSRFDVAHELGHLILHRYIPKDIFEDEAYHALCEKQANIFASAFLLPAETFAQDLRTPTIDGMRLLKRKWGVAISAMITRASTIGLISQDEAVVMHKSIRRRGWHRGEPLDDEIRPEEPRVLARSLALIVEGGLKTPADIQQALCLHPSDIIQLCNLDADYFTDAQPSVRLVHGGMKIAHDDTRHEQREGA